MNLKNVIKAALSNANVLNTLGILKFSDNYNDVMATIDLIQPVQKLDFDLNSITSFSSLIKSIPNQYLYFDTTSYCSIISGTYLGAPYQNLKYIQYLANNFLYIIGENNAWLYDIENNSYYPGISSETQIVSNSGFGITGSDGSDNVYIGALWDDNGTIKPVIYKYTISTNTLALEVAHTATNSPTIDLLPKRINGYYDPNLGQGGGFRIIVIYDHVINICNYDVDTASWGNYGSIWTNNYEFARNCIITEYDPLTFWALIDWRIYKYQYIESSDEYINIGIIHEDMYMDDTSIGLYIDIFTDPNIENAYIITDSHEIVSFNKESGVPINSFGHFGKNKGNQDPSALWGQISGTVVTDSYNKIFIADNRNQRITMFMDVEMPDDQTISLSDFNFGVDVELLRIYPTGINIQDEIKNFSIQFSDGTQTWLYKCSDNIELMINKLENVQLIYNIDNMYVSNWKLTGYTIEYRLPLM